MAGSGSTSSKVIFLTILAFGSIFHLSTAQVLTGRIKDTSSQPVQYATVFISELKQGTTSNTKGDYEIRLPSGKYTVFFQSLGYEPVILNITLASDTIRRDVTLTEQIYQIGEVKITSSGEDPAYPIMRRVIGLAPYHLNQVGHYRAQVYLKGNLVINRIPGIIKRQMKVEARNSQTGSGTSAELKEGDSYFMESFNEIEFDAPDKYVQKVISFNSTFPSEGNDISPMDYIKASFYQPVIADMAISPLSPSAFAHYNFRYIGATPQGDHSIDKIEVIPKRKSQQLFSGTLYIVDELSCLQSVELTNKNLAGIVTIKQLYIPVQDDIWMPVSHNFSIDIGIMGFRADAAYGSSVKYLEVVPDPKLRRPDEIAAASAGGYVPADSAVSRNQQEIQKILGKDELSNRDMVKLSKLMKKESESDTASKSLEVSDNTRYIVEKGAGGKDSTYWNEIRPIPLSEAEIRSLRVSDSIKAVSRGIKPAGSDTSSTGPVKGRSGFKKFTGYLLSGHTWADTSGRSFRFDGFLKLRNISFNTVDGFVYGVDFRLSKRLKKNGLIGLYPGVKYAFSREKLMWHANLNYSSGGLKPWQVFIRSGMISRDFNSQGGIDPLLNSLTSLLLESNYLKLYDSKNVSGGFRIEPKNGLKLEFSGGYEQRKLAGNTTDFSIFRTSREYTFNIPPNPYLQPESNSINLPVSGDHFEIVTNVTISPFERYRIVKGARSPAGSDWPEFTVRWKHGIDRIPGKNTSQFDMFVLGASQRRDLGAFSQLRWRVRTGGYADNRNVTFYDFFHFNSQSFPVLFNDYDDVFMLPGYYSLSTPEIFGEAHLKYTTPYLLLKLLPGLSNTLIRENLSISYLGSRYKENYTELGYSLSEILFIGEAGVYVGFNDLKFSSIGAKFIFRFR